MLVIFIISYLCINIINRGIDYNSFPIVAIFALAGLRILPSAAIISNGILMISYCNEALNVIYSDLRRYKTNTSNASAKISKANQKKITEFKSLNFKNSIELKNLSFSYENTKKQILENINLELNKNEFIGLIGNTGSGKTTLVDILLGFLKPTNGKIIIDSNEQDPIELNLAGKIVYLPQENFIINDTLEANIALDYNKNKIDQKKIQEILSFLEFKSL